MTNRTMEAVTLELSMLFGSDFADIFEVKDRLAKTRRGYQRLTSEGGVLGYERDGFRRETLVRADGGRFTGESVAFRVTLDPHQTWETQVEVALITETARQPLKTARRPNMEQPLDQWLAACPTWSAAGTTCVTSTGAA